MMLRIGVASSKVLAAQRGNWRKFPDALACARARKAVQSAVAMPDATIQTRGKVLETRGAVLYRVELPNGKVILAHLSKELADAAATFAVGDDLLLELTPFDFDQARILAGGGA
jgi:translation initiation factor IF-1